MMKAVMRDEREMICINTPEVKAIPINWTMTNLQNLFYIKAGGDAKPEYYVEKQDKEHPYPVYTNSKDAYSTYAYTSIPIFEGNTITVSGRGAIGQAFYREKPYDAIIRLLSLSPKLKIEPKYYTYWINNVTQILSYSTVIGQLSAQQLAPYKAAVPSLYEQQLIAHYLDERCSKIDAIIAEAKASIEEYKELKQAVIYEAVTKGLDKNAKMKDSSIEWLGSIPAQWNLVKTNRIIDNTQNGLTRRDLDKSDGQIVLKLKNINAEGEIDYSDTNRIQLTNDEIEKYRLHNGDLLFVRVNGSRDLVGKCAIFEEKDEAIAYNDHIIRVTLNDYCIPEYVKWYLLCDSGKSEIALKINTAAGQFTISGEGLRAIYMPLPSLNEQREIVEFLNNKTKKIDFIINEKQSLIEDLEAYKKSLIYEVVTGKRKVVA